VVMLGLGFFMRIAWLIRCAKINAPYVPQY
jgi:hypothetical protein